MATTTKEHLTDCAGTILADAWEWATRSWAVGGDYTYEETENRKYTSFSFDLYDTEDDSITLLDADDPKWGEGNGWHTWTGQWAVADKPLHIDADMVVDFIVKSCTDGIDDSHLPDYARLYNYLKQVMRAIYFGDDDPFEGRWDAVQADALVQYILFGEIRYA